MAKSFYPPLWNDSAYPTVGTAMTNPSYTAVIKLTQTYTPTLLNETAFLYSGNKITLTPQAGFGGTYKIPSGWTAQQLLPGLRQRRRRHAGNRSAGFAAEHQLERRPTIPGRTATRASSTATICPGPKAVTSSNSALACCTITRTSSCRPIPRELLPSTSAPSPTTPTSTSCWAMLPALRSSSIWRISTGSTTTMGSTATTTGTSARV